MEAHTMFSTSSAGTSTGWPGASSNHATLPRLAMTMAPKPKAKLRLKLIAVRELPLAVTLKGRPKGRSSAEASATETGSAATACAASVKMGSERPRDVQPETRQCRDAIAHEFHMVGLEGRHTKWPIDGRADQQQRQEGLGKPVQQAAQVMQPLVQL